MSEAEATVPSIDIRPFIRRDVDGNFLHGLAGTVQIPENSTLSPEQSQLTTIFNAAARYACAGTDEALSRSTQSDAEQTLEDWRMLVMHMVVEQLPLIEKIVGPIKWSMSYPSTSDGPSGSPQAVTLDPETGTSSFRVCFNSLDESLQFLQPIAEGMPDKEEERTTQQRGYVLADHAMLIWNTTEGMIEAYNNQRTA